MPITRSLPSSTDVFDLCVVGSGPAGLAVALACGKLGHSVLILEAGGNTRQSSALQKATILNTASHAPLNVSTREGLGGTSVAWGGLCVPYDPIDFQHRPWLENSGWPIPYTDLMQWYTEAAQFLGCGTNFQGGYSVLANEDILDSSQIGQISYQSSLGAKHLNYLTNSQAITLCLGAPAAGIVFNRSENKVVGLDVGVGLDACRVSARQIVLAAGGLQTTRLLLTLNSCLSRRQMTGAGPLGKYYMGHLTGEIANIVFHDPQDATSYLPTPELTGGWHQRRFKLRPSCQRSAQILNNSFTLRTPSLHDHRHQDGALSLISLLLPLLNKTSMVQSYRLRQSIGELGEIEYVNHLRNILRNPKQTAKGLKYIIKQAQILNVPIVNMNISGRYTLRYHAEQAPNSSSKVYLDPNDKSRIVIDFRYSPNDIDSVVLSHDLLDKGLSEAGVGHLEYLVPRERRHEAVWAQAQDGYHQIGTTRMSKDASAGVVDTNCKVHGFDNLYVASASTFPTSGSANPTLSVAAMSLRLANHISGILKTI